MADSIKRPNLTNEERNRVAQWLLQHSTNGCLHHGAKKEAADLFHVDVRTIFRIWKAAAAQIALGKPIQLRSFKKGSTGKNNKVLDVEKVKKLSVLERSSLRGMAEHLGISKSLLHIFTKKKLLKPVSNAVKPFLTPQNMINRLTWSLMQLKPHIADGKIPFQTMYNTIHVDEKWFYLTKVAGMYYLLPDEIEPHRTCKSKRFIEKIMFLCVVSRPIIDSNGNVIFDGKIGIFPFITTEPAKRNSKNRVKGTMQTKTLQNITQEVMRQCFINWLVPTIKAKWPEHLSKNIFIQQDNAKPHIKCNDPDFLKAAQSDGFNIQLVCQPSNSPDTNVLDLGFFRAIQSLKDKKMATTVDDMMKNVNDVFDQFPAWKINYVFLTLQACCVEIMKKKGNNNYKIPHFNKDRLRRLGQLPQCFEAEEQLVMESLEYLKVQELKANSSYNVDSLVQGLNQANLDNIVQGFNQWNLRD